MKAFESRLVAIETYLKGHPYPQEPAHLYDPIRYFMALGGKRIRPLFTVLCAELFRQPIAASLPAAAAIEMFHNFTLIHDDIMDQAPKRRNLPTVHEQWNSNIAILSGDALMIHAFKELEAYDAIKYQRLSSLLNKTAIEVCIGQQMDMDFEQLSTVSQEDYLSMIRLKTSVLLGCACAFGGILGDATEQQINTLYGFGEQLGIAFQIQDDLLDTFGTEDAVGKQIGGDILCDKKTLLYIAFHERADKREKALFEQYRGMTGEEKIEGIKQLYWDANVLDHCKSIQEVHWKNTLGYLDEMRTVSDCGLFQELLQFIVHRNY